VKEKDTRCFSAKSFFEERENRPIRRGNIAIGLITGSILYTPEHAPLLNKLLLEVSSADKTTPITSTRTSITLLLSLKGVVQKTRTIRLLMESQKWETCLLTHTAT
jgi:hypothetical protein